MRKASFADMHCAIAQSLEVVGEWWTLLILRDAFLGVRRFEDFVERLGISRNVLTIRLDSLVAAGILERRPYDEGRGRYDYLLTDKGRALWPVMTALRQWGDEWIYGDGNEPLLIEHRSCGCITTGQMTCSACGEALDVRSVRALPGPGGTSDEVRDVGWKPRRRSPTADGSASVPSDASPSAGAPNVVIVLMDQSCYADPEMFGGRIRTPTLERLAASGVTYPNFKVNAACAPTRTALLTGRNSHQNSMATVTGTSTAFPGDTGSRPLSVSTVGTMLSAWGYCTGYFGKNNEVPDAEVNVSGPFDRWPIRSGFDKFYGYIAGEQSNLFPSVLDGVTWLGTPREEGYHFNTDMTNKAIAWMQATRSLTPDRPFLMYYAQSASHPPHTPPADWLAKDLYKGVFDDGWDSFRETALQRQIELGIVPPGTTLAANPDSVQRWDELDDDAKKVFARQMEVYATLTEHADYEVGRLVDAIEELGELDNTLFFYIFGDNGGSLVGDLNGCFVEWSRLNEAPEDVSYLLSRLDEYGGPSSYPNYAVGWALAGSTPCTWAITMAHGGANMAPLVVHWPKGIDSKGELRRQYHHVIDVVPTILECVGIPEPKLVNGVAQLPMPGVSMRYTFDDGDAPDRHITQYNESIGNRSIYHEGWLAAVVHMVAWEHPNQRSDDFANDKWELYDTRDDFGLAHDVAGQHPEKLEFLKQLFYTEALRNNVFPLDDRAAERLDPKVAGRPDTMFGRTELTLYPGMPGLPEGSFINTKAVSFTIEAELTIPEDGADGVVLCQAGQFGGWSLYVTGGRPKYVYNWLARAKYEIEGTEPLPAGNVSLVFDFDYDGGGPHKGATGSIIVNGNKVGEGRIEKTMGALYSLAAEPADIGHDSYSPVTDDYDPWDNAFTGTIHKVTVRHKEHQPA